MIKILVVLLSAQMIMSQQNAVANKSVEELSAMMGAKMPTFREIIESQAAYKKLDASLKGSKVLGLPQEYDARSVLNECEIPVRNQGQCGSCWAFASSTTFNFNLCAASNQQLNYAASMQQIIDCVEDPYHPGHLYGCNGGHQRDALTYIHYNGITNNECMPYEGITQYCRHQCTASGKMMTNQKCSQVIGHFGSVSVDTVKRAIMQYGAVTTAFFVYQDLASYSSGVYQHTWGAQLGGHAITVIGWGIENGVEYWLTQNSWGSYWGLNGYWKHAIYQPGGAGFFGTYGYWYCAQQQTLNNV